MFGGLFNRMYYGNPNKPDLKEDDIKVGKFKLFFTVLQVRFWKLLQLNLMYSIFWAPAFFLVYINLMAVTQSPEIIEISGNIYSYLFTMFVFLLPLILLTGPATAGAVYIIRNWARDEHAWILSDFKDAWKKNWKESLLIMLINGLAIIIIYVNINFYSFQNKFIFMLLKYLIIMLALVFSMMNMFVFPMLVTYKLKLREIYKNAFIFTMAELPRAFIIFLIAALIAGVAFFFSVPFIIPFFLIGLSFPLLITTSFANWVFDKYMHVEVDQEPNTEINEEEN